MAHRTTKELLCLEYVIRQFEDKEKRVGFLQWTLMQCPRLVRVIEQWLLEYELDRISNKGKHLRGPFTPVPPVSRKQKPSGNFLPRIHK